MHPSDAGGSGDHREDDGGGNRRGVIAVAINGESTRSYGELRPAPRVRVRGLRHSKEKK